MSPAQERIYLNPPRFWAATKNMAAEDVEELANEVLRLAAERRVAELEQYDFICFGHKKAA